MTDHYAGLPYSNTSTKQVTKLRNPKLRSAGEESALANLTFATPPDWMNVKDGDPTPNCMRSRHWMGRTEKGELWDLDLREDKEADEYAANLCAGCPIIQQCLDAAMEEEGTLTARNRYLVRGGMTPTGRFKLAQVLNGKRRYGIKFPDPPETCGTGHESPCRWYAHPNGSWACKERRNALRRERKEAA